MNYCLHYTVGFNTLGKKPSADTFFKLLNEVHHVGLYRPPGVHTTYILSGIIEYGGFEYLSKITFTFLSYLSAYINFQNNEKSKKSKCSGKVYIL